MKKIISVMITVVLLAFLTGCSGTFIDPGHGGAASSGGYGLGGGNDNGGSGNDTSVKPAKLSNSASQSQAVATLDAIIKYCNAHSGNDSVKEEAQYMKTAIQAASGMWSMIGSSAIDSINDLIDRLE